jgi:isocitrate/isopropylmalate dehydrogenase
MQKSSARLLRVGVIAGDGIGPELTRSASEVLRAAVRLHGGEVVFLDEDAGAGTFRRTGAALTEGALDRIRGYDALLKGPVGLPGVRNTDGTEAGLLGGLLRGGLDTYANLRPVRLLPGVHTPTRYQAGEIDYVIVRENTEGLYLSRGVGVRNDRAACDQLMMTREGVERVVRRAFGVAEARQGAPADGGRRGAGGGRGGGPRAAGPPPRGRAPAPPPGWEPRARRRPAGRGRRDVR